jgi:hypothetical protein
MRYPLYKRFISRRLHAPTLETSLLQSSPPLHTSSAPIKIVTHTASSLTIHRALLSTMLPPHSYQYISCSYRSILVLYRHEHCAVLHKFHPRRQQPQILCQLHYHPNFIKHTARPSTATAEMESAWKTELNTTFIRCMDRFCRCNGTGGERSGGSTAWKCFVSFVKKNSCQNGGKNFGKP